MWRLILRALTFGMALLAAAAHAQTAWPTKQIRILVGYAAGGSTDVTARIIAQALSERREGEACRPGQRARRRYACGAVS